MKNIYNIFALLLCTLSFAQTTHYVNAGMMYFTPAELTIEQGDVVIWINDGGNHDINGQTSSITGEPFNNPESFSSDFNGTAGEEIYSHTFNIDGLYNYDCSMYGHAISGMIGTINVTPCNGTWIEATSTGLCAAVVGEASCIEYSGCLWESTFEFPVWEETCVGTYEIDESYCDETIMMDCTLSGGENVVNGWTGYDTGDNWCNSCLCENGMLSCTELDCGTDCEVDLDNDGICDEIDNCIGTWIENITTGSCSNFDDQASCIEVGCSWTNEYTGVWLWEDVCGYQGSGTYEIDDSYCNELSGECISDIDEDGICEDDCEEFQNIVVDCECEFLNPNTYTWFTVNVDEESCTIIDDCSCECINDVNNNGICDEDEESSDDPLLGWWYDSENEEYIELSDNLITIYNVGDDENFICWYNWSMEYTYISDELIEVIDPEEGPIEIPLTILASGLLEIGTPDGIIQLFPLTESPNLNMCENDCPCVNPEWIDPMVMCTADWDPVIGCDGIQYSNDCVAAAAGVTSWTYGNNQGAGGQGDLNWCESDLCELIDCRSYYGRARW